MNIERLKSLLGFLKELPEEKFDYRKVLSECRTVACVAGWCVIQNGLYGLRPLAEARRFLELRGPENHFLFVMASTYAKKSDAIKRLEWLIEHGTTRGYPVYKESWVGVAEGVGYLRRFNEFFRLALEFSNAR